MSHSPWCSAFCSSSLSSSQSIVYVPSDIVRAKEIIAHINTLKTQVTYYVERLSRAAKDHSASGLERTLAILADKVFHIWECCFKCKLFIKHLKNVSVVLDSSAGDGLRLQAANFCCPSTERSAARIHRLQSVSLRWLRAGSPPEWPRHTTGQVERSQQPILPGLAWRTVGTLWWRHLQCWLTACVSDDDVLKWWHGFSLVFSQEKVWLNVEKSLECIIQRVDKLLQERRLSDGCQDNTQTDLQGSATKKGNA